MEQISIIPERLINVYRDYIKREFADDDISGLFNDPTKIGIAWTEDFQPWWIDNPEYHEMQVNLNLVEKQFEYFYDDELIYTEKYETVDQICDEIEVTSWDGWYEDFSDRAGAVKEVN